MADSNAKSVPKGRVLHGRSMITIPEDAVTPENVKDIIRRIHHIHEKNRNEIEYLYDYYKGKQPILNRVKTIRPEICNKIVENRANEIVAFKVGYLCGEPIQYVSDGTNEDLTEAMNQLNSWMDLEDKPALDQEIIEWQMIGGTAYRLVLPAKEGDHDDDSPFHLYTLDPRQTYVIYSNDIYKTPLAAVTYARTETEEIQYVIYTPDYILSYIDEYEQVGIKPNPAGRIPIFEYPANNARLGAFEIVLPLLDMINDIASNRMDGLEQTVQAFLKFINCEVDADMLSELKDLGAVMVKSIDGATADVDVVKTDVDQNQTQTLTDDLYDAVLTICGMPNRNGGSSTSDTGSAVILRDGWSAAETRAKDSERIYKKSERKMLKLVLDLCAESGLNLRLQDIKIQFTRRNYDNIQSKSQTLTTLLSTGQVHPLLAFQYCGLFVDPESAYEMSKQYAEEQEKKQLEQQERQLALSAKYDKTEKKTEKSTNAQKTEKS